LSFKHSSCNHCGEQRDTITVEAGTYTENLTLGKSLTIKGAQFGVNACGRSARLAETALCNVGCYPFRMKRAGVVALPV
jgi:hypothetical protein